MESNGEAGKITLSENMYFKVKDKLSCEYRGAVECKNKGPLETYFLNSGHTH